MANNIADRDAYIIIGVTDGKSENEVEVTGVHDYKRKSQESLIDFLKDKNLQEEYVQQYMSEQFAVMKFSFEKRHAALRFSLPFLFYSLPLIISNIPILHLQPLSSRIY